MQRLIQIPTGPAPTMAELYQAYNGPIPAHLKAAAKAGSWQACAVRQANAEVRKYLRAARNERETINARKRAGWETESYETYLRTEWLPRLRMWLVERRLCRADLAAYLATTRTQEAA